MREDVSTLPRHTEKGSHGSARSRSVSVRMECPIPVHQSTRLHTDEVPDRHNHASVRRNLGDYTNTITVNTTLWPGEGTLSSTSARTLSRADRKSLTSLLEAIREALARTHGRSADGELPNNNSDQATTHASERPKMYVINL